MLKILHTSDWHLGKYLNNYSRHKEQEEVMEEICLIAEEEQADAIIVAGDLFDQVNPPTESIDLFYKTLKRLSKTGPVIAIAGNHDSPDRIEAPDPLARECGIIFSGYPHTRITPLALDTGTSIIRSEPGFLELKLPRKATPLRILLTPYANELRMKKYLGSDDREQELRNLLAGIWGETAEKFCNEKGVNILLTHLLMAGQESAVPEEPEDEKPILHVGGAQAIFTHNVPQQIQYVALGHLHRKQTLLHNQTLHAYCGSPLAYSFSEAEQKKYALIAEISPGKEPALRERELTKGKPLMRKRFDDIDKAVDWLQNNPGTLLELTISLDSYLTAEQRKRLSNAHNGIIAIIPDIKLKESGAAAQSHSIDITKNMEELFRDYFIHAKGEAPNNDIMDIFKEIMAQEDKE